jgi:hypothetical protein
VSRIWNPIREPDEQIHENAEKEAARNEHELAPDRRSSERLWLYSPVLVYGHTVENLPFHEGTEALRANARGGLITLITPVRPGQRLLIINKANEKEIECNVVSQPSKYLERAAVVVGFLQPAADFWLKPA